MKIKVLLMPSTDSLFQKEKVLIIIGVLLGLTKFCIQDRILHYNAFYFFPFLNEWEFSLYRTLFLPLFF